MPAKKIIPQKNPGELNQRILVIDDNRSIHDDIRKILGSPAKEDSELDEEAAALFGVEVETLVDVEFEIDSAFQGQEGLKMVQAAVAVGRPYAMAFVDVRMPPGWDGVETITRIWKLHPDLQIVICTAYSDYSWADMIRKFGKTDSLVILKKPFDNVEVLQLAHTLTQKWTLSHRLQTHLSGLDEIVEKRTEELQAANARLRLEMRDREQAENDLRHSEDRFARAFQASPIPMAIQSLSTERFLDVNDAFLEISGWRRLEVISRTPDELKINANQGLSTLIFEQLKQGKSVRNFECPLRARSGETRECVISAEVFQLGDEKVALLATLDVSEQRNLEKQLRHSQKLEAVGQFAAGVAHDFNNMLTVIQGHASIHLAADNLDKGISESLNHVSVAAERAATLTRQLLAFSRKQVVQMRPINLNDLVKNLDGMLSRLIGEHIQLKSQLSEKLPAIRADQSNLEQIVMNLVVNARDAMPKGGKLIVATRLIEIDAAHVRKNPQAATGEFVCLTLSDTGCGMTPETVARIFEPFFTTKEVGKGTGLGLATVYGLAAQHEGWIEVESQMQEGSTFKIYFPAIEEKPDEMENAPLAKLSGGNETILVVEDEPAVREIMTYVLRDYGYHVLEASDGPSALKVWAENHRKIDLLVTDIVMPNGMSGNAVAEHLQSEKPALKVIFSSGYSSNFATLTNPQNGLINFLEKPYKPEILVRAVRDCLDGCDSRFIQSACSSSGSAPPKKAGARATQKRRAA